MFTLRDTVSSLTPARQDVLGKSLYERFREEPDTLIVPVLDDEDREKYYFVAFVGANKDGHTWPEVDNAMSLLITSMWSSFMKTVGKASIEKSSEC